MRNFSRDAKNITNFPRPAALAHCSLFLINSMWATIENFENWKAIVIELFQQRKGAVLSLSFFRCALAQQKWKMIFREMEERVGKKAVEKKEAQANEQIRQNHFICWIDDELFARLT